MTIFQAWQLPPDFILDGSETGVLRDLPDSPLRFVDLSGARMKELVAVLRRGRDDGLSSLPVDRILSAVDEAARRLREPEGELREGTLKALAVHSGLSLPMAAAVLDGMSRDWMRIRLEALLRSEFPDPGVLDGFRPGREGTGIRALGFPLTFHLGAGTVPGVSVTSLVRALLVKSAVLLKPGRGDVVLPVAFARTLAEVDPILARSVAVLYWPRDAGEEAEVALHAADLVVAYGGDSTVTWARSRLSAATPLIAFRHRIGIGVVGRAALGANARKTAGEAAGAVALFDQKGCVSPQVLFVERGGEIDPRGWARLLASALQEMEGTLPSGRLSPESAVALQQTRGRAEAEEGSGRGAVYHGGRMATWTVLYEEEGTVEPTCLARTVRVVPVDDAGAVPGRLEPWRRYLQTLAVAGLGERRDPFAEEVARIGVSRVTSFKEAPWPPAWWHHDGLGPLRAMARWTDLEGDG